MENHLNLTNQVKISKNSTENFSTIIANTPENKQKMFGLFRGKDSSKCGQGNFGKVKLAQDLQTGEWCAVKISKELISANDAYKKLRLKVPEIEKAALDATGQLKGHAYRLDEKKQQHVFYIFMKYIPEDKKAYGEIDVKEFLEIAMGALHSLKKLHAKGFLHRDIKLPNTAYNPDSSVSVLRRTRLIDLGSALPFDDNGEVIVSEAFGTTDTPLEWKQTDGNFHFTQYTDMFNMGATLERLWESLSSRYQVDCAFGRDVSNIMKKIYPHFGKCFSQLTASEAFNEFEKIYNLYGVKEKYAYLQKLS